MSSTGKYALRRIRLLFRQLPALLALRMVVVEAVQWLIDPYRVSGYALSGEDRIVDHCLSIDYYGGAAERIFYVDIGCNSAVRLSNTMRLYQHGARGLAVDGNAQLIKKYSQLRPRDIAVCACVSNESREATFVIAGEDAMSTLSATFESEWLTEDTSRTRHTVKTVTLQQLFEQNNVPEEFDLLSIDVEGHDYEALTSFDIAKYRPKLIIIEMHRLSLKDGELGENAIYAYLTANGYRMIGYVTVNGYFMREVGR